MATQKHKWVLYDVIALDWFRGLIALSFTSGLLFAWFICFLKLCTYSEWKWDLNQNLKVFLTSGRINWKCHTDIQYDCLIKVVKEDTNSCLSAHPADAAFLFVSDGHSPCSFLLRNIRLFGCWMLHCVYQLVPNFVVYYLVLDRCLQQL